MDRPNTKFICVAGPQEAGKSHLSNVLARACAINHDMSAAIDAIAKPIYDIARILTKDEDFQWDDAVKQRRAKGKLYKIFGLPMVSFPDGMNTQETIARGEMHGQIEQRQIGQVTGRELLQDIGGAFRKFYGRESFWIEQLVARNQGRCEMVFVSDCRMPSEIEVGHFNIWIETKQPIEQQRPNDDTERHLDLMRERSHLRLLRDGKQYFASTDTDISLPISVDHIAKLVCERTGLITT